MNCSQVVYGNKPLDGAVLLLGSAHLNSEVIIRLR